MTDQLTPLSPEMLAKKRCLTRAVLKLPVKERAWWQRLIREARSESEIKLVAMFWPRKIKGKWNI